MPNKQQNPGILHSSQLTSWICNFVRFAPHTYPYSHQIQLKIRFLRPRYLFPFNKYLVTMLPWLNETLALQCAVMKRSRVSLLYKAFLLHGTLYNKDADTSCSSVKFQCYLRDVAILINMSYRFISIVSRLSRETIFDRQ